MFVRIALAIFVISALAAPPAFAQARADVGVWAGFTLSDGVSGNAFLAGDGNIYDRVDPKDGGSWGFNVGFLIGDGAEVGFLFGHEFSTLQISGTNDLELGDLSIKNYHGYFAYNFGESDAPLRPFVFGGLGATSFGSVDFQTINRSGTIEGESQFSTTWGAGVKFLANGRFGGRFHLRITPTYIKTDSVGWWCDPYWGCYLVGDAQYSNQIEFAGGIVARF
jgi:Outer membrane protein beta-barrel domain